MAAIVEYDGTDYCGWQAQPHAPAVQQEIETALSFVAGHPLQVVCAGRTDAGVHAVAQVVHFETNAKRSMRAWVLGSNTRLPPAIALNWAGSVDDDFHARHAAERRSYRYYILNRSERSALNRNRAAWIHRPLDADKLHAAAQVLLGEHDFSAFRAVECQSKTAVRKVDLLRVQRSGDCLCVEIRATAFLHHMVRNIVGTLIELMDTADAAGRLCEIVQSRDRRHAGPTAPAPGLYFWQAHYPARYGIPATLAPAPFIGL